MRKMFLWQVPRPMLVSATCLALFGGVWLARSAQWHDAGWLWLVAVPLIISLRQRGIIALILLILLGGGLGWWRGSAAMIDVKSWQALAYTKVTIQGVATDEAVYTNKSQLEVVLQRVRIIIPEHKELVGNVTVRGFGLPAIYRGDTIQATAKLYPSLGNSVGRLSFAELSLVESDSSAINELRRQFAAGMQSALPEPQASFALGLLIGQRTTLPEAVDNQLRHVGLTHVIAVSGYNLTVIVMACRRFFANRSKYQATLSCIVLMTLFLLITGSCPPVVRASIVCILGLAAWYYGRTISPIVLLLVSAAITVLANPMYLWGNVSWYLSFLAFFGVLVLSPIIVRRYRAGKELSLLSGVLLESACASITVLPYVLYIFGETSVVGLLANVLVVPLIPIAMVVGLAGGLAGMLIPWLAGWFAWPATILLTYMLDIANILSRAPHAFIEDVSFSLWAMLFSYLVIVFFCIVMWHKAPAVTGGKQGTG